SAEFIRGGCRESPSWDAWKPPVKRANFDRHMAPLLDAGERTRFILRVDADGFHRVSAQYDCTNEFLASFLASVLHPDTKGAKKRAWAHLKDVAGFTRYLFPDYAAIRLTLVEGMLKHGRIQNAFKKCREDADKTVIGVDGQYSTLLSGLYQTQHGRAGVDPKNGIHVQISAQCMGSVLLVQPAPSEGTAHIKKALLEAVGRGNGATQVRMICADAPVSLDESVLRTSFTRLQCLAMGPLHIALKVEQASGGKRTPLSNLARRCIVKFSKGIDDGRPYYRRQKRVTDAPLLEDAVASLSDASAARIKLAIGADGYAELRYRSIASFARGMAALCK
ncbi:unnamed protein product, partial [Prorocentrum cordatum]